MLAFEGSVVDHRFRGVPPLSFDESAGFTVPPAFGAYRVLHQIGSGVLGPVFRTYDPQRDRLIAVKAFRLDIVPEQVARLAEALRRLAASDLNHPAIVGVVDAGLEGTTAYLAMDFVAAETLDVALRHLAPSPLDRAWPILAQIGDAIEAAWAKGLGHGALHPRDVFVTSATNEVRVTGFGVVPALESVGVKPPVRRPYAAPERATSDSWDIRADVYSLGAIAHELLTRRRPAGPSEQDGALVTGTTPEQRVLIRRVLSAALAERPEDRFATPAAFVKALDAIVKGEPLEGLPVGSETHGSDAKVEGDDSHPPAAPVVVAVPEPAPLAQPVQEVPVAPPVARESEAVREPEAEVEPQWSPRSRRRAEAEQAAAPAAPFRPAPPAAAAERPTVSSTPDRAAAHPAYANYLASRQAQGFPWIAVAASLVAGVALGSVITFRLTRPAVVAVAPPPVVVVPAVKPNDTEVTLPAEKPQTGSPAGQTAQPPADTEASKSATPAKPAGPAAAGAAPAGSPGPRGAAPAAAPGRLLVRSVPSGATLTVDGHAHGPTPATVRDLSLGTHTLLVSHPGYAPHTEKLTLTAEQPARNVTIELKPARVGRGASGQPPQVPGVR